MACSKYEYVKNFEQHTEVLLQTYMMVRIDGKGFTKFCEKHKFQKPNDIRSIDLMNEAALFVMNMFKDIFLAYGQSDQYSFVFARDSELFNRRAQKIVTCVVSAFSSSFVAKWSQCFGQETKMKEIPVFDARLVCYPNLEVLKDYFRWRQADCHINNLYNTVFWCLVKSGKSNREVESFLKDTNSGMKNEILFTDFGINYNTIEEVYRKGSVIGYFKRPEKSQRKKEKKEERAQNEAKQIQETEIPEETAQEQKTQADQEGGIVETKQETELQGQSRANKKSKQKYELAVRHVDLIREQFWDTLKCL